MRILTLCLLALGVTIHAQPCGAVVDTHKTVTAFSNASRSDDSCEDPPKRLLGQTSDGQDGYQYQCVELIRRFYRVAKGVDTSRWRGQYGDAKDFFLHPAFFDLVAAPNGGTTAPEIDDIVGFAPTPNNSFGHVAIVKDIRWSGDTFVVDLIEQNTTLPHRLQGRRANGINGVAAYELTKRCQSCASIDGWMRPSKDLLHQLEDSQIMTNSTFPGATLSATLIALDTGDVSTVEYFVQSDAGSVNWSCQDRDYGNPRPSTVPPYAYFGSHISEDNGGATTMQLRTVPNTRQTIRDYAGTRVVKGHTYICSIYNSLSNGGLDYQHHIVSKGNGRSIYFRATKDNPVPF